MTMKHLDDDAEVRWQLGESTEAERAHVARCTRCQAEVLPLADTLQQFGIAAREWGERKAACTPQQTIAPRRRVGWETLVAVAAVLLFAVVMTVARWHARQVTLQAAAQQQREQQLAQDDALLEAVDQDVAQGVPDALAPLTLATTTSGNSQSQQQ